MQKSSNKILKIFHYITNHQPNKIKTSSLNKQTIYWNNIEKNMNFRFLSQFPRNHILIKRVKIITIKEIVKIFSQIMDLFTYIFSSELA